MSEIKGTFQLDTRTLSAIDELRVKLRARSSSDVIRNALALLKVAVDNADDSLVIRIPTRTGEFIAVDLKVND